MHNALKSISIIWGGMLLAAVVSFLSQVLLARGLSLTDYGLFSAISNLMLIMAPAAGLGMGGYWLKKYGQNGWSAQHWITPSIKLLLISIPFSLIVVALIGNAVWSDTDNRVLIYLLSPIILMRVFSDTASTRFQLEERYTALAIWRMIPPVGRFLLVLLMFVKDLSLYELAIGICVFSLLVTAKGYIYTQPLSKGSILLAGHGDADTVINSNKDIHKELSKLNIFKEIFPFALGSFFGLIYLQSDIVLLSLLAGNDKAGLYNAAFSVMVAVYLLPTAIFNQFLLPKFHRWAVHDVDRFLDVFRFGNASMLLSGFIIMLLVMILSPFMIPLIFGDKYIDTVDILIFLSLCIPLRFLSSSVGGSLVTKNNMKRKVLYQGSVAVFNVLLNVMLIPYYHVYGAVLSTVLSELILLSLYLYGAHRYVFKGKALNGWHLNWRSIST